jgi:hypothetical protein
MPALEAIPLCPALPDSAQSFHRWKVSGKGYHMLRAFAVGCLMSLLSTSGAFTKYGRDVVSQVNVTVVQYAQSRTGDPRCSLPPQRGACKANFEAYHFVAEQRTCKSFFWGGCGTAPFETKEECERICIRP